MNIQILTPQQASLTGPSTFKLLTLMCRVIKVGHVESNAGMNVVSGQKRRNQVEIIKPTANFRKNLDFPPI